MTASRPLAFSFGPRTFRVAAGALFLCLASSLSAPTARAAAPAPSAVSIRVPEAAVIGEEVSVSAQLTSDGKPVASRLLVLMLDGVRLRTASVDGNGRAQIPVRRGELAVAHLARLTVAFAGSSVLGASSASAIVDVRPARITIETVPASDNISVTLGELHTVTKGGIATFNVPKLGRYSLAMSTGETIGPDVRADFIRWGDNVFAPTRPFVVDGDASLQLGLHIAYRASFQFRDTNGRPVDRRDVESLTLTSTGGTELALTEYQDVWLEAGTAVQRATGLENSQRNWRVLKVEIKGTNVVNRGQQRVDPRPAGVSTVEVLLYDLSVEAHDALFGIQISGSLQLEYPDGSIRDVELTEAAGAQFLRLPRGNYTLRLHAGGLGAPTPVVLSRDQVASIRVITYADIGLFAAFILSALAALLWFGRRNQLQASGIWVRHASAARLQSADIALARLRQAGQRTVRSRIDKARSALWQIGSAPQRAVRSGAVAVPRSILTTARGATAVVAGRARKRRNVVRPWRRFNAVGRVLTQPWSRVSKRHSVIAESAHDAPSAAPSLADVLSRTVGHRGASRPPSEAVPLAARVPKQASRRGGTGPVLPGASRSCPVCKRKISARAEFCSGCGARVES